MSLQSEFYLGSDANVVELELLEISHPDFTKVYYIVRNAIDGITVTHEDASVHDYEYYPLKITPTGASDNLDQILKIVLGDLGEKIPKEIDAVRTADTFETYPVCIYRTYRSDDLTQPLNGPLRFQIQQVPQNWQGATLEAGAPRLNLTSTGERYTNDRFTPLKGFL